MSGNLNNRYCTFYFYQYTALRSRAENGHQMYSKGSGVSEASIINSEISSTSQLIFTAGQKVRCLALFSTSLDFEPPAFENTTIYLIILKQICSATTIALCPFQVG